MNNTHIETGRTGEQLAAEFLQKKGMILLEQNYRFASAEIDLILLDGNELVFVEVKTRTRIDPDTLPENAVDRKKQQACFKAADSYIYERKMLTVPVRFDVVAVRLLPGKSPEIVHFPDAFRGDDTLQSDISFWE